MYEKITTLSNICSIVAVEQKNGQKIVHCHGVFDLLHPGHIRHLQEAKKQGDKLVVSITPDRYVNKGPGRPAFNEKLRMEQLASLSCVDFVVLNDSSDAVSIIQKIKPNVYVKGDEYRQHEKDITGKISEESNAVQACGGEIHYTNDIVFSSSGLLNRYFDSDAERLTPFFEKLKREHSLDEILQKIEELSELKVLVIGDAIIDEYQYIDPLGQSGKGVHLTARLLDHEKFLGGSLIIANHLASFAKEITLLTGVGKDCPHRSFIEANLDPNVKPEWVEFDDFPTLTKKRYVIQDGKTITKLFETYSSNQSLLKNEQTEQVLSFLKERANHFDIILVSDFGNGFTNTAIVEALSSQSTFLALNTQTNSGNRGYNVVTHYHRADFISLNEPELRLAAHDRSSRIETVAHDIAEILHCPLISVTRGVNGVFIYPSIEIPALTTSAIDRVGAGDSYFALAALCAANKNSAILSGFVGSIAAAIDVQIVGNKAAINKMGLCKYIIRLLK